MEMLRPTARRSSVDLEKDAVETTYLMQRQNNPFKHGPIHKYPQSIPNILKWLLLVISALACFIIIFSYLRIFVSSPSANAFTSFELDAIAMISMGEYCRRNMADGLIDSLHKYGPPNLQIYVLTDLPHCFHLSQSESENVHLITVESIDSIADPIRKAMVAKSYKTKLLQLLPENVSNVLYLDIDIQVTTRFREWVEDIPRVSAEAKDWKIGFQGERPGFESRFNGGLIYLERNRSEECLKKWGDAILSGEFPTDQIAFRNLEPGCEQLLLFDHQEMKFMRDGFNSVFYYFGLASPSSFLHFTHPMWFEHGYSCSGLFNCFKNSFVGSVYRESGILDKKEC